VIRAGIVLHNKKGAKEMENSEPIADEEDRAVRALRREVMMLLLWAPSLEDLLGDSIQEICDQVDQNPDPVMAANLLGDAIRRLLAKFQDPETVLNALNHERRMQETMNAAIQEMNEMEADYENTKQERDSLQIQVLQQKKAILELHDRIRTNALDAKSQHHA
jgi:hypothetical protein